MDIRGFATLIILLLCGTGLPAAALADGLSVPPESYPGSLVEQGQEAILIFHQGDSAAGLPAQEDLILNISVAASQPLDGFAWIVPFPAVPETLPANGALFSELFDYVQWQRQSFYKTHGSTAQDLDSIGGPDVTVLRREAVGVYDVAIVDAHQPGALPEWLAANGYATPAGDAFDGAVEFYRKRKQVFACIQVREAALQEAVAGELHPLHFRFATGGYDGMVFPMQLTAAQAEPVSLRLYVFYRYWVNFNNDRFGIASKGFTLTYRDWDSEDCEPNSGKLYSRPAADPFLRASADRLRATAVFFETHFPGERFYLNVFEHLRVEPDAIRAWDADLWMYPNYTQTGRLPVDLGGPATASPVTPGWRLPVTAAITGLCLGIAAWLILGWKRPVRPSA